MQEIIENAIFPGAKGDPPISASEKSFPLKWKKAIQV